ncbi:MAG TPA: hypothetical protein VFD60_01355, partial [Nitrososphaeraceae archaeon]|nr:hypothetical protein [Nitrososphaeraceae archaeon]
YNYNSLTYRELKRTIESKKYLDRNLSRDTFNYHIHRIRNGGYIYAENIEPWKLGKKKFFHLSSSTKEQIELNALIIRYNEVNNKREEKILQSHHKLKKRDQIVERHSQLELTRKRIYYIIFRVLSIETPNRRYKYPGTSVTNIMNGRYDGHAFYYLRLEECRSLVEDCVQNLLKLNVIREVRGFQNMKKHDMNLLKQCGNSLLTISQILLRII